MKLYAPAILILYSGTLAAQQPSSAIEKQRLSVRKQVQGAGPVNSFFTTPWLDAPSVTAASIAPLGTGDCEAIAEASLTQLILEASQKESVSPKLVQALVKRESGGKPCAVSPKGAQGLMQLMPGTQADMGVRDPFDPAENISGGVKYLKQMLDRYQGNTALALAAYNAGPQRVALDGKIPDIPETQAYVMNIMGQLNEEEKPAVK